MCFSLKGQECELCSPSSGLPSQTGLDKPCSERGLTIYLHRMEENSEEAEPEGFLPVQKAMPQAPPVFDSEL